MRIIFLEVKLGQIRSWRSLTSKLSLRNLRSTQYADSSHAATLPQWEEGQEKASAEAADSLKLGPSTEKMPA
jgi:hypothetical protein